MYGVALLALMTVGFLAYQELYAPSTDDQVMCPMDALICPDGSSVGRSGPDCSFAQCPRPSDPDVANTLDAIEAKADLIYTNYPKSMNTVSSPLEVEGHARGTWFSEASFRVYLRNSSGDIIATGYATAYEDWMTEEFVPFSVTLEFEQPTSGTEGALVLIKDNPSGLPENDDELEIPVIFE